MAQTGSGVHSTFSPFHTEDYFTDIKKKIVVNAEIRNGGAIPPFPLTSSCTVSALIKHKENFIYIVIFEVLTAVTLKNVVFWDIKPRFVPHRRHITYPLQISASKT
jgi:hypothetical protein